MNVADLRAARRRAIRAVKKVIEPHLRASGYNTCVDPKKPRFDPGNRRPLMLWCPQDDAAFTLRHGYVIEEFYGFSEHGVITDYHGGGMVTAGWSDLPLEDLLRLKDWASAKFALVGRMAA